MNSASWLPDTWWTPSLYRVSDSTELVVRLHPDEGRPVMLVHGLASNALLWRHVAENLASRGHAVAVVDLRGHGLSERPNHGYSTGGASSDIADLTLSLGWAERKPLLVGQSWGGNVAIRSAAALPNLWGGVVCVDGGWIHLQHRFGSFEECWQALTPPGFAKATPEQVLTRLRLAFADWPPYSVEAVLGNLEVVDGRVQNRLNLAHHRSIVQSLWEDDPAEDYPHVSVPVQLLVAGQSHSDDVDRACSLLRDATARWYPDAHHDLHLQRPSEVTAEILNVANRVAGSST